MNDYTKDLIDRLLKIDDDGKLISETITHIRDLVSSAKMGWEYAAELETDRDNLQQKLFAIA